MKVEIWSDVVCPWCYIGKRRFETALSAFEHRDDVEVIWRSYQLDPSAPANPNGTTTQRLAEKYGVSLQQAEAMNARVTGIATGEGLDYHMEKARSGNTFDAHRLIHLAATHNLADQMKERLMRAYFTEGAAVGDPQTLVKLAVDVGIDAKEAEAVLQGDTFAPEVRVDEQRARMFGITGVPFFAVDETYGVSGAQPAEALKEVLEMAWAESHPLSMVATADGDICEGDACEIPQR